MTIATEQSKPMAPTVRAEAVADAANPATLQLLEACGAAARPYEPQFDVEEQARGFWIRDHGKPVAFIDRRWMLLDAFEFSPFHSLGRDLTLHPRYDMGTYINMHATLFQAIEGNHRWPTGDCRIEWDTDDPRQLKLDVHAEYRTADDEPTGQYLYRFHKRLRQPVQRRQEFCNVYPKHLGNGMPSGKKWQHTVWTGPDGNLWKMPHSPALAYGVCSLDEERCKSIAPRGFLGWGVEEDFNLVVLFEHASVPVVSSTCDMWFDEHLTFEKPGMEYLAGGPAAEVEVTFRLLNAPAAAMRAAVEQAKSLSFTKDEIEARSGPAFIFGQVNDMDVPMDPHVPQAGQFWRVTDIKPAQLELEDFERRGAAKLDPARHVAWVNNCGHSGKRSIRLRGMPMRILRLAPGGHSVHAKPNTTYRFEGWIKTRGAEGRLWIGTTWYSMAQCQDEKQSPSVAADTDWMKVKVQITTKDYPYILCRLVVEGDGEAWFDDLRCDEV
jgi:hypothetical protein